MKEFIEATFTMILDFCPMQEFIMGRKRKKNEKKFVIEQAKGKRKES